MAYGTVSEVVKPAITCFWPISLNDHSAFKPWRFLKHSGYYGDDHSMVKEHRISSGVSNIVLENNTHNISNKAFFPCLYLYLSLPLSYKHTLILYPSSRHKKALVGSCKPQNIVVSF